MKPPIAFRRQSLSMQAVARHRETLKLDPIYQRQGDVWSRARQRLFIDSILNGFFIPPLFWHELTTVSEETKPGNRYAVVDGKQRLQAIYAFLDNELALGDDSTLLEDENAEIAGRRFEDLKEQLPWLYARFLRSEIDVIFVDTDEIDLIEELFFRLKEGVPLSAAEKRNRGPIMPERVTAIAVTDFFVSSVPFGNQRYRHYDLIAKFLRIEDNGIPDLKIPNLRKRDLDRLFDRFREFDNADEGALAQEADELAGAVTQRVNQLSNTFNADDALLSSVGMVTLFYVLQKVYAETGGHPLTREEAQAFEALRTSLRDEEADELDDRMQLVDEFGAYAQGPTSGVYLSRRLEIFVSVMRAGDPTNNPVLT